MKEENVRKVRIRKYKTSLIMLLKASFVPRLVVQRISIVIHLCVCVVRPKCLDIQVGDMHSKLRHVQECRLIKNR